MNNITPTTEKSTKSERAPPPALDFHQAARYIETDNTTTAPRHENGPTASSGDSPVA